MWTERWRRPRKLTAWRSNRTFREAGYDWEWSRPTYRELLKVTGGVERITHFLRTRRPGEIPEGEMLDTVKALHKAKTANYVRSLHGGEVPLRPGVERLLTEARAGRRGGWPSPRRRARPTSRRCSTTRPTPCGWTGSRSSARAA